MSAKNSSKGGQPSEAPAKPTGSARTVVKRDGGEKRIVASRPPGKPGTWVKKGIG